MMFRYIALLIVLSAGVIFFNPTASMAANAASADLTEYNAGTFKCPADDGEYTQAIVSCIEKPVRNAVLKKDGGLLALVSKNMISITSALATLAIIILGIRAATGDSGFFPRAISLAIRIGFVIMLISQSGKYAKQIYDIFDGLVYIGVPSGFSPWKEIDKFLGQLIGFTKGMESIKDGIIGLIDGSFWSKNLGVMVSLVGGFALVSLLTFVFQAVYLYLSCAIAVGFMLIISPIVIPFFIFTYTEHLLMKWFDILIANIITPMLMFAFLAIFMFDYPAVPATSTKAFEPAKPAILKSIVDDIFTTLGPNYLKRSLRVKQPLTPSYMLQTDVTAKNQGTCFGTFSIGCNVNNQNVTPSIQTTSNSNANNSFNYSFLNVSKIDFGAQDKEVKESVFMLLLELLIFTLLMNGGLKIIPSIASDIARGATTSATNMATPLSRAINAMRSNQ